MIRSKSRAAISRSRSMHDPAVAGDRDGLDELLADDLLVTGPQRQVVSVLVALLGAEELGPEPLPAEGNALPDLESRGLAGRPGPHVVHRLLLVLVDAHRDEEVDGEVAPFPAAALQALVDEVELPAAELGVGRPHHHGTVAGLATEPQHPGLGYREVERHLAGVAVARRTRVP